MNPDMLLWIAGFILAGLGLKFAVDLLMKRYNVKPENVDEHSRGFHDVLVRYRAWLEKRRHQDDASD